ncbi:MAG: restriction endonuclease subunit S [Deltaproteobacteria bacterium]|nr:restriction endonuclease subunit S [Deltaproteobacteria bacterium]
MEAMEIPEGFKKTEVGIIPNDWVVKPIGDIVTISVGRDLKEENYSKDQDSNYQYPVYSNTVSNEGLYGFYNISDYSGESLTVVGRGVGLGTAFKRKGKYGAIGRLLVLMPHKDIDAKYLTEFINYKINIFFESSGVPQLTGISFAKYKVAFPPIKAEQTAIATALHDADALISSLEKLIAKKRGIKQGAMQELLKPKAGWEVKKLGEVFEVTAGGDLRKKEFSDVQDEKHPYPIYSNAHTNKGLYGYCKTFDYEGPSLTITARGGIGFTVARNHKFAAIGRLLVLNPYWNIDCGYVAEYINLKIEFAYESTGVPQLTAPQVSKYEIPLPSSEEQTRIAQILSDMDAGIDALKRKLEKYRLIKQGMMQNLLMGRIRLV